MLDESIDVLTFSNNRDNNNAADNSNHGNDGFEWRDTRVVFEQSNSIR